MFERCMIFIDKWRTSLIPIWHLAAVVGIESDIINEAVLIFIATLVS